MLQSRYPEAIVEAEHMRASAHAVGDRQNKGEALADLAIYHQLTFSWDHMPQAQKLGAEALGIAQEIGDERVVARSLIYLGSVDQMHGKLLEGDSKLEQALRIGEASGFQDVIAQASMWLGAAAEWRGEFQRTITLCQQGERVATDIYYGSIELIAQAFRCLAHIGVGEYAEALAAIHDGIAKARIETTYSLWGGSPTPWAGCTRSWEISSVPPSTTATALTSASVSGTPTSRSAP
jgi:hypothetical protein